MLCFIQVCSTLNKGISHGEANFYWLLTTGYWLLYKLTHDDTFKRKFE